LRFRRGTLVGLPLVTLGLAALLVCSIPVTTIEAVIDTSFAVAPGTEYGPPNTGTSYHARVHFKGVLGKSVLRGEVLTEGEGIHLTVRGYNAEHLADTYAERKHSFLVDPADDLYTFTFRNDGRDESVVRFMLEEIWTRPIAIGSPPLFVAGSVAFSLLATGLVILIVMYLRC
jgi:hypothetical protein